MLGMTFRLFVFCLTVFTAACIEDMRREEASMVQVDTSTGIMDMVEEVKDVPDSRVRDRYDIEFPPTADECVVDEFIAEGSPCDDGDACTIDVCIQGMCRNRAIDCDDGNPWTDDECIVDTGACSSVHRVTHFTVRAERPGKVKLWYGNHTEPETYPMNSSFEIQKMDLCVENRVLTLAVEDEEFPGTYWGCNPGLPSKRELAVEIDGVDTPGYFAADLGWEVPNSACGGKGEGDLYFLRAQLACD